MLEDASLAVERARPSSCSARPAAGKTVLLRLIAGIYEPDAGDDPDRRPSVIALAPEERDVGMAFQNFALYPHMTRVREHREPAARPRPADAEVTRRVAGGRRRSCASTTCSTTCRAQLSNGQKQRTSLARSLVPGPAVLLLDDPLRNVDAKLRYEMRLELPRVLQAFKATVLYVTQDYKEAMALGDRVAVLMGGRFVQVDQPAAALHRAGQPRGRPPVRRSDHQPLSDGPTCDERSRSTCSSTPASRSPAAPAGPCLVGIRPEHVEVGMEQCPGAIPVELDAVTPLNVRAVLLLQDPGRPGDPRDLLGGRGGALSARPSRRLGHPAAGRPDAVRCRLPARASRRAALSGPGEMATLTLDRVSKVYGPRGAHPVLAVDAVDMAIGDGEIVGLLGSSGCGKTSTLRMIAGFEDVTERRDPPRRPGHQPAGAGPAQRRHGVRGLCALSAACACATTSASPCCATAIRSAEVAAKVGEIAGLLEIEDILDRYPPTISAGQQQRTSLARALIRDADLFLLDEPMSQLEPQLRAILRARIKDWLISRRMTTVFVTHDQTEAIALADRIAVMEKGVLAAARHAGRAEGAPGQPVRRLVHRRAADEHLRRARAGRARLPSQRSTSAAMPPSRSRFRRGARASSPTARASGSASARTASAVGDGPGAVRGIVASNHWLGDQSHLGIEVGAQPPDRRRATAWSMRRSAARSGRCCRPNRCICSTPRPSAPCSTASARRRCDDAAT